MQNYLVYEVYYKNSCSRDKRVASNWGKKKKKILTMEGISTAKAQVHLFLRGAAAKDIKEW